MESVDNFKPGVKANLEKRMWKYKKLSRAHSKTNNLNRIIYYTLGSVTVICSVTCTALSASLTAMDSSDQLAWFIFVLSLIASILSSIGNFFGIERMMGKHNNSKVQYRDLAEDVEFELLSEEVETALMVFEQMIIEKEKFIRAYEPPLSPCFDK